MCLKSGMKELDRGHRTRPSFDRLLLNSSGQLPSKIDDNLYLLRYIHHLPLLTENKLCQGCAASIAANER